MIPGGGPDSGFEAEAGAVGAAPDNDRALGPVGVEGAAGPVGVAGEGFGEEVVIVSVIEGGFAAREAAKAAAAAALLAAARSL